MNESAWTVDRIPDLTGKSAVITGVTGGLGEQVALELARRGAHVIAAARNQEKLHAVTSRLRELVPEASVSALVLDLADLSSVRTAAAEAASYGPLHLLVNNAGVMATPQRRTVDDFDLQFGTNHLGHFALTGLLWPQLVAAIGARVVTVSSAAHRLAQSVPRGDPRQVAPGRYSKWRTYGHSKLANLLFALELDRRARAAGAAVTSLAAHPGYASTNLVRAGRSLGGWTPVGTILDAVTRVVGQSAAQGALPILMAATMPDLPGASYVGPGGPGEWRGAPRLVGTSAAARDQEASAALWDLSQEATGVVFP